MDYSFLELMKEISAEAMIKYATQKILGTEYLPIIGEKPTINLFENEIKLRNKEGKPIKLPNKKSSIINDFAIGYHQASLKPLREVNEIIELLEEQETIKKIIIGEGISEIEKIAIQKTLKLEEITKNETTKKALTEHYKGIIEYLNTQKRIQKKLAGTKLLEQTRKSLLIKGEDLEKIIIYGRINKEWYERITEAESLRKIEDCLKDPRYKSFYEKINNKKKTTNPDNKEATEFIRTITDEIIKDYPELEKNKYQN